MIGFIAIFLAFIATVAATILYLRSSDKKGALLYSASSCLIFLAAGYLYYLIFSDNFRYTYVFGYSSRDQAFVYKLSAFWAGQEGSFLLWAVFHAIFGLLLARNKAPVVMATHSGFQLFLLTVLIAKSPFKVLPDMLPDGVGLNPLLQDPWMIIHPPVLFLGYAALAVPFAWAIHGLITGNHKETVARALPWTLFAWAFLGAGIFIGGFWAYKVLGWGGYWAWDPVENSSLVPWLATGALLHLFLLARIREGALFSAYFTAIIDFVLVLYGTYLTRSGVMSDFSTHSFESDGGGGLLASFMLLTAAGGFGLLIWRWPSLPEGAFYISLKSRDFFLVATAVLLAAIGVTVLIGTSAPLLTMLLGSPHSVDISFYNLFCLPLAAILLLFLAGGSSIPLRGSTGHSFRKTWPMAAIAVAAAVLAAVFGMSSFWGASVVGLAAASLAATTMAVIGQTLSKPAGLTHAGLAVALTGIVFSSLASSSVVASFEPNRPQEVLGRQITYLGELADPSGKGFYHRFSLDNPAGPLLLPYTKQNSDGSHASHEPGIFRGLTADIYLAVQVDPEAGQGQRFELRKGEEIQATGLNIKFVRFGMENGGDSVKAYAVLEVSKDGDIATVKPEIAPNSGKRKFVAAKAFDRYEIILTSFDIRQGLAGLAVRDMTTPPPPTSIAAEVSRKPLISVVWLGVILITVGTGWAAVRRSQAAA